MDDAPAPPARVQKRDGRLEPFEADKISRALFAAAEAIGLPDAFLARELTDGVVHFLTEESDGGTPTTSQIAELVVKVVRELGQPALAEAFAEHGRRRPRKPAPRLRNAIVFSLATDAPPGEALAACVRSFALQAVFARDLIAAHADELLTLAGLEAPAELAGCVLGPPVANPAADGLLPALARARRFAAGFVVLDGPEHLLACAADARDFARELAAGLRLARLRAVVNLNAVAPPPWAGDLAAGPLFAGRQPTPPDELARLSGALAEALLTEENAEVVRVDWHVAERDFTPPASDLLARLAERAVAGAPVGFVFDRPRRPVALAEGLSRPHPAVLLTVAVHLPHLAEQPGVGGDPAAFLKKLGPLARLALSAAVQKRDYLRRRERTRPPAAAAPDVTGGFLLDRARLVVTPVGLDAVVRSFTGGDLADGDAPPDFGKRIVQTLRDVLTTDGRRSHLSACVDGPFDFRFGDGTAPVKAQLRAAGALHAAAEHGTLALSVPEGTTAGEVVEWLRTASRRSDVVRLCLASHGGDRSNSR
jgi:hypothetical protein